MVKCGEAIMREIVGTTGRTMRELVYDKPVEGHQLKIWVVTEVGASECADCWFEGEYNGVFLSNMSGPYLIDRLTEDV